MGRKENKILILMSGMASGKSSIIKELVKNRGFEEIKYMTTRAKRSDNDTDYIFLTDDEFYRDIKKEKHIAWQKYFVNTKDGRALWKYYQPKTIRVKSKPQVIQIPYIGAVEVAKYLGDDCILMYLDCPEEIRRERAIKRGDRIEEVERRIKDDRQYIKKSESVADVIIPTDRKLEDVIEDIIGNYELKRNRQKSISL